MKALWLAAAAAAALSAAHSAGAQTPQADFSKAPRMGTWGFDLGGRDLTTAPGQDFYDYANGTYLKNLEIPADRTNWGAATSLGELSQNRMRVVVEKAAADKASTGDVAKVGALYGSFMDEKAVEALGAKPLAADLAKIRAEKTRADIARTMGKSLMSFGGSVFSGAVEQDAKDPDHYAVYLGQAGLGLPDRDYYLQPSFAPQKAKYEEYVARVLTLAGWPEPAANAKAILALETEIAKVSWTRAERRDDVKTYNAYAADKLGELAPGFDWNAFLAGADLAKARNVVVQENTAFPKIAEIYAKTPHRHPEGLAGLLPGRPGRALSLQGLCGRPVGVPQQDAQRRPGPAGALEARGGPGGRPDRRGAGQALRRRLLPAREQGQDAGAGR